MTETKTFTEWLRWSEKLEQDCQKIKAIIKRNIPKENPVPMSGYDQQEVQTSIPPNSVDMILAKFAEESKFWLRTNNKYPISDLFK